jgi:hypothetical protein
VHFLQVQDKINPPNLQRIAKKAQENQITYQSAIAIHSGGDYVLESETLT